jgi:hypothetical protein
MIRWISFGATVFFTEWVATPVMSNIVTLSPRADAIEGTIGLLFLLRHPGPDRVRDAAVPPLQHRRRDPQSIDRGAPPGQ